MVVPLQGSLHSRVTMIKPVIPLQEQTSAANSFSAGSSGLSCRRRHNIIRTIRHCVACSRLHSERVSASPRNGSATGGRRDLLQWGLGTLVLPLIANAVQASTADPVPVIRLDLAPDQATYDPTDPRLRDAAGMLQLALNAESLQEEEERWTQLIEKYKDVEASWKGDVVGRAYGNRGNARTRQGRFEAALSDFNTAIALCPWSVDPVLNRGVLFENTGRFEEAVADYQAVLKADPRDPSGWNNLGNVSAALGKWAESAEYYGKAVELAPAFSFAAANRALALYQLGRTNESMREMRRLLRRFPDFPDMRAALTAALWEQGSQAEAETQWERVDDPRYKDRVWLKKDRHWPPRLVSSLAAFLDIKAVAAS
eukprot:jgi/Botrbrau1/15151/Bobra.0149s0020.1